MAKSPVTKRGVILDRATMAPKAPRPIVSREEKCKRKLDDLLDDVRHEINYNSKQVAAFAEKLVTGDDALYVIRWGDDVVQQAAKLKVLRELENVLVIRQQTLADPEMPYVNKSFEEQYDLIVKWAVDRTMNLARQFPSSTSQMANLAENREREAWANLFGAFGGLLGEVNGDEVK